MQREDQPTMATKLEQIAVKARREANLRFTSLAHHVTRERVLKNLLQIPKHSAAGVDGQTVEGARESFEEWHHGISDQVSEINAALRGHYAYYGIAGNIRALFKVYLQPDPIADTVAATQTASPVSGAAGTCGAVDQLPKSVVREIRTPRSVGTGGGSPVWLSDGELAE